ELALDDRGLDLELTEPDRGGITARAGADHDCIETLLGHGRVIPRRAGTAPTARRACACASATCSRAARAGARRRLRLRSCRACGRARARCARASRRRAWGTRRSAP